MLMSCSVWETFGELRCVGALWSAGKFLCGRFAEWGSCGVREWCSDVAVWGICSVYES